MKTLTIRPFAFISVLAATAACTSGRASNATAVGTTADVPSSVELRLVPGTSVTLRAMTTISSRHNHAGDPVEATAGAAVVSADGDTVIPAGAVFYGRVGALAPAPHPDEQGVLRVSFSEVRIRDARYPVHGDVTYLATAMAGRGVTAGTAAKVGAGALIGGVAGHLIGRSGTGTVIGAVAGGAGGAVVAHATRTMDVVLPAGAEIRLKLTEPFVRTVASRGSQSAPPVRSPSGDAANGSRSGAPSA